MPFEFAVVAEPDYGLDDWVAVVRSTEELGYDALLVTDHLRLRLAAVPALALAAGITTRIRLGSYVLNADLRNPAVLAPEMATLHTLSRGRAVAGLGVGWMRDDYARAGTDLPSGPARLERLRVAVTRTREALASAAAGDGNPPTPPGWAGAAPGTAVGRAGGRHRQCGPAPRTAGPRRIRRPLDESVESQLAWVRAAAAGRDAPPRLNHLLWGCHVTENPGP